MLQVSLRIFRFDPARDKEPHYDTFRIEAAASDRVLDCLNKIRWEQDGSLAYRMSCAHGICGSDGMTVNGVAVLACQKLVKDYDLSKEIVIQPLGFFPVVKDLVVDIEPFFEREKSVHPKGTSQPSSVSEAKERIQTPDQRKQFDDDIKCIMCACCVASCPVNLREDPSYVGPAAIVKAHRYIFDSRLRDSAERMKIMDQPHGVWGCKTFWKCTEVCPKEIKVTDHILETKSRIMQELHSN